MKTVMRDQGKSARFGERPRMSLPHSEARVCGVKCLSVKTTNKSKTDMGFVNVT